MAYNYNLTQITQNASSMPEFALAVSNVLVDGMLGFIIVLGILVVLLLSFYFSTKDIRVSVVGFSFIVFIVSVLFRSFNFVSDHVIFGILILFAISLAFLWKR